MNMFQEKIETWLSRRAPERALNQCFGLSAVLATDIGLERTENQDRVAALKVHAKSANGRPLIAVAVADGMGGMLDGAKCATLALSSFFYALISHRGDEIDRQAAAAISYANDEVFSFAAGKGGATLSAILIDRDLRPFIVHLGDSRVYSFGGKTGVKRLTTDDSFAEAVGGHGRELLQFVGMGEGMQPHIMPISDDSRQLVITTDGIHFIESATLESVLTHSKTLKAVSERLSALARWCGGPDNASSALVDLPSLMQNLHDGGETGIELWDPFGALTAMWVRPNTLTDEGKKAVAEMQDSSAAARLGKQEGIWLPPDKSKRKVAVRKSKRNKKDRKPQEAIPFEIKIEQSESTELPNEDRK
jgi:serine/threonine protein phosphatase PrpC